MLTRQQITSIKALGQSKERKQQHLFLAEGPKLVGELISSGFVIEQVYGVQEWQMENRSLLNKQIFKFTSITQGELSRISTLVTPNQVVAIAQLPVYERDESLLSQDLTLYLDGIKDPGNLGTILRIADWFGIKQVFCSIGSVDAFSPKVVQSTMGSIFRIKVFYEKPDLFFHSLPETLPVYGAFLEGEPLNQVALEKAAVIVIGSESHGISQAVADFISTKVRIPSWPASHSGQSAESLNASVATGILCYAFRNA